MRDEKLTVTLHIGGSQVESLTPKQCERMSERLRETMSLYYTANSKEYSQIKK